MITEDYVSYEVAKLLKQKGFDEGCSFVVNAINKGVMPVSWPTTNSDIEDEKASLIALPTLQMTMKWLREIHHIIFVFKPSYFSDDECTYWSYERWCGNNFDGEVLSFKTYEEAVEAAIKYTLENLI